MQKLVLRVGNETEQRRTSKGHVSTLVVLEIRCKHCDVGKCDGVGYGFKCAACDAIVRRAVWQ